MTYDEALAKAVKLLRLSQSDNPNESALAASRAQEIIDRYNIESAALSYAQNGDAEPDEPIKDFNADPLDAGKQLTTWKWRLFLCVAKPNGCRGYKSNHGGIAIVGMPNSVATVRYLFAWFVQEVDRLAKRDCAGNGRSYANNFRNGVIDTLKKRMDEQHKATKTQVTMELTAGLIGDQHSLALMRVEQAIAKMESKGNEVESWMKAHLRLSRGSSSRSVYNPGAREAGRIAGREVRFTKAVASIG